MKTQPTTHDTIQNEIVLVCSNLGFNSIQEYTGKGWRADVFAEKDSKRFAFEIQISPQSLERTIERQEKYIRDDINCCWLFEKSPKKLTEELSDLPLFNVIVNKVKSFSVSLSDRKVIPLSKFIEEFLTEKIKFCFFAHASPKQKVKAIFYEMKCWKCNTLNHVYYVDANFRSSCNATVHPEEVMWGDSKIACRPEIIKLVKDFSNTPEASELKLATIKKRHSNMVQDSYMSFGCYKCDSIFGDWYMMEAEIEVMYGEGQVAICEGIIDLNEDIDLNIPHWCYPEDLPFCDQF